MSLMIGSSTSHSTRVGDLPAALVDGAGAATTCVSQIASDVVFLNLGFAKQKLKSY